MERIPFFPTMATDRSGLSAGPIDGLLVSGQNLERPSDTPWKNFTVGHVEPPSGVTPAEYFARLQRVDVAYCDCADYDTFPGIMNSYNSNSYVGGLIWATGGRSSVDLGQYYGGQDPIPLANYLK